MTTTSDRSAALQKHAQKVLDTYTAGKGPNNVPGAVAYVSDKSGKDVIWAHAGVKEVDKQDPMTKDTIFWIASCSKLFIAIACLQLRERGQLDFNDSIDKFLPEAGQLKMLKDGSKPNKIPTVHDCLAILSGQACALFNQDLADWFQSKGTATPPPTSTRPEPVSSPPTPRSRAKSGTTASTSIGPVWPSRSSPVWTSSRTTARTY